MVRFALLDRMSLNEGGAVAAEIEGAMEKRMRKIENILTRQLHAFLASKR